MPPDEENSSFYVAQYQSLNNGVWCDWSKWFDTRIQAWQWIEEQIDKQKRYGTAPMNYRVRCQPKERNAP
jgi:hypothetical protein